MNPMQLAIRLNATSAQQGQNRLIHFRKSKARASSLFYVAIKAMFIFVIMNQKDDSHSRKRCHG